MPLPAPGAVCPHPVVPSFRGFILSLVALAGLASAQTGGMITGTVVDADSGQPIAEARVHEQAAPTAQIVITNAQVRFQLPVPAGASNIEVAAARTYDPDSAFNYRTDVVSASDGHDIFIPLDPIPGLDNTECQPVVSTDGCRNCHTEQWNQWQQSKHSGAAVRFDQVASEPGLDGVTCTSCHQLHRIADDVQAIHLLGKAEFRFPFTGAPGQETYEEWQQSPAAAAGIHCQDCHMPIAAVAGTISTNGQARDATRRTAP